MRVLCEDALVEVPAVRTSTRERERKLRILVAASRCLLVRVLRCSCVLKAVHTCTHTLPQTSRGAARAPFVFASLFPLLARTVLRARAFLPG